MAGSNAKSATLQIYSNDTTVYNIDIENSYGTGGAEGSQSQALALCQAGARNGYYSSGFYSFQVCPEIKILATIEAVANGIN